VSGGRLPRSPKIAGFSDKQKNKQKQQLASQVILSKNRRRGFPFAIPSNNAGNVAL
jgi:hypothetical protein